MPGYGADQARLPAASQPNKGGLYCLYALGRGYFEEDIGKIWGGNWLRVMDTVWGDPDAQIIDDDEDTPDGVPHLHKH